MKYWNIDVGNITITFAENSKEKMKKYLSDFREDNLYEGWIGDTNPSRNSIGFYISQSSDEEEFSPNFVCRQRFRTTALD